MCKFRLGTIGLNEELRRHRGKHDDIGSGSYVAIRMILVKYLVALALVL